MPDGIYGKQMVTPPAQIALDSLGLSLNENHPQAHSGDHFTTVTHSEETSLSLVKRRAGNERVGQRKIRYTHPLT